MNVRIQNSRKCKLEFMTNIGTILGHDMKVKGLGFALRFLGGGYDNLAVLLERHKWYVVAF